MHLVPSAAFRTGVARYETTMGTIAAVALVLGHEVRFTYERALCKNICAHCLIHMSSGNGKLAYRLMCGLRLYVSMTLASA